MGLLDEAIREHLELKRKHGASDEEVQLQEQEALGPVRREPAEPPTAGPEEPAGDHEPETGAAQVDEVMDESEVPVAEAPDLVDETPAAAAETDVVSDAPDVVSDAPDVVSDAPDLDPGAPGAASDTEEFATDLPDVGGALREEDFGELVDEAPAELAEEPIADPAAPGSFQEPPEPFSEPLPDDDVATELLEPDDELEPLGTGDTPSRGFGPVDEPLADDPGPPEHPLPEDEDEDEDVLEETPEFLQETPEHDRLWFEQKPPRDFEFDE